MGTARAAYGRDLEFWLQAERELSEDENE
nr:DUF2934 domain-containing protein [Bradyrhizobium sp. Leo121]